ncbi:hypothetical protein Thimo_2090 [Thioflavicoccus mobilis 8321]|uniref:HEAT repeat domain-containing protein n=1 Tax=Thioflavicoccus mobilis 8321 TaxID=765912 RepID=L0GYE1_9GAMM|nr:hypothetical protein [Thioflavicoccus mobilis]AGA90842.1 hypothetical protein Thimo_2090 [Thioflavicoccus mobilis 8321]
MRERLAALEAACSRSDDDQIVEALRTALADRHYRLVARAAELAGDRLLYAVESELRGAYARFLDDPIKRDPGCTAKGAIARALVALDCQDADFYTAGLRYRQPEPVWGGTTDRAVDLRVTCAIGLAATAEPRALIHLVQLLHDPEPHARCGAVRAIGCTQPLAAEAVLRAKVLSGDEEPEVTGEAFAALLQLAEGDALDFVAGFLEAPEGEVAAMAALALGASHLDAALERLRARWAAEPLKDAASRVLLQAAALHRSVAALEWLTAVIAEADLDSAEVALTELARYRRGAQVQHRLAAALAARGDARLLARFAEIFPAS